ncbi:MAG TPA: geranylgeranylglycerol-phosphate geranylgeranyltransferase [Bacteroidales bacterium]|nr:geranylgeranylglycerol-phosphate geranylgeranyltransferase [Bacteroidales bacterium]HPT08969.1 geranylgeranylglycerol-phosphate geranylgeranyltransferase [Bacteroidales bacterium]
MEKFFLSGKEKMIALSRLIRLPNLGIIVLTQCLLRYCLLNPFLYKDFPGVQSTTWDFFILVLITLLIAAGGYVINDYFDVKIDQINRPDKVAVNRVITPRQAIKLHMILNALAILLGFYLAYRVKAISMALIFPFLSGLLWIYSAKYKRILIWGNVIVSFLSAFVILIVWLFEFFWIRLDPLLFSALIPDLQWVNRVFFAYALFAFLVTLFREVIKDMEDVQGDQPYDCRTLPVVSGLRFTSRIVSGLILITMLLLGYSQYLLYQTGLDYLFWYFLVAVQLPALYLLIKLQQAKEKEDYHSLSTLSKIIMLAGILSMELILLTT